MRIIVFGATGLIGTHLVEKLLNRGFEVTGTSRRFPQKPVSSKLYHHVILDISKKEDFKKLTEKYDCVFNMAAHIAPGYLTTEALPCLITNALGTLHILDYMTKKGISRLIHSSSVTVYGKPKRRIVNEHSPTNPIIVYGVSKLTAEKYCHMYSNLHDLKITILRYGSVYGPGLNQRTALPLFIEKALSNKEIILYGDGTRNQDYVYVDDVITANLLTMQKKITGVFNIGSGLKTTMRELAETIIEVFLSKSLIRYDPKKIQEFSIGIDITKAKRELGYKPQYNLKTGLQKYRESLL